jgi:lipopolysaccharide/colanic/teichoic acid biosynthesis glycosyltransferase
VIPYPLAKQVLDKTLALTLLVLLSPIVVVVVVAMLVDSALSRPDRGAILYSEPRVSQGQTFRLLKFRTLQRSKLTEMHNAGAHARLYESNRANLTWAGRRLLKPWYLDEIPQLLNVLRGDISLVGPRPWPPEMVARQVAEGRDYRQRIVAGLTGPAQVTKGTGIPYADLDERYVAAAETLRPLALVGRDVAILWRTIGVIARGEGLDY